MSAQVLLICRSILLSLRDETDILESAIYQALIIRAPDRPTPLKIRTPQPMLIE